jgi:hypothetical protein
MDTSVQVITCRYAPKTGAIGCTINRKRGGLFLERRARLAREIPTHAEHAAQIAEFGD